jgi:hypothetical protein
MHKASRALIVVMMAMVFALAGVVCVCPAAHKPAKAHACCSGKSKSDPHQRSERSQHCPHCGMASFTTPLKQSFESPEHYPAIQNAPITEVHVFSQRTSFVSLTRLTFEPGESLLFLHCPLTL